jgi:hypothetical protein
VASIGSRNMSAVKPPEPLQRVARGFVGFREEH